MKEITEAHHDEATALVNGSFKTKSDKISLVNIQITIHNFPSLKECKTKSEIRNPAFREQPKNDNTNLAKFR